ncbi:MAG: ferrous iron transporter B [Kiritimatiellia bacterium]
MKVLLMGNPNVGKSAVFNRLTGANVIVSNYPGTTVEFARGRMRVGDERAEVIDVPGTYSLEPRSRAEKVASGMLDEVGGEDVVVNVIDSTNLERSLGLTLQLLKRKCRTVVALNFWDETKHTGVDIDAEKLSTKLGVPCVPLVAVTGMGVGSLVKSIEEAPVSSYDYDANDKWRETGKIVEDVQKLTHRHHTFLDRLSEASVGPITGPAIAVVVLFVMFEIVRFVGEGLIAYVFEPFFELVWAPVMLRLSGALGGEGLIHDLLIGKLIDGQIDFGESFGLLTTGLFVPFAAVLPYVAAFYLVLSFMEDSGYLPRLAVLTDTIMHKLGLHGMGAVPMLLGLGCNVPGALSVRIMESRKERFIATTLMAIAVPCMAQISMIVGLAGEMGAKVLAPIFLVLFAVWLVIGVILNKTIKGESPEILMDMPPYRVPYLGGLAKKVWMRIVWFLREAVPWVLAGVFIVNLLYALGIIQFTGKIARPVVTGALGLPQESVGGLVIGFLRKDVAVGMLAPLGLNPRQLIVASVVLAMYFPCVATFAVMIRELGVVDMLKSAAIMIVSALTVGSLLNLALQIVPGW